MRALVLTDFDRLAVEDRPDPEPGDGEIRLRVVATGICGSDIHGFTGENGRRVPGQIMGHETVARIDAIGPGVDGAYSEGTPATFNPVVVPPTEAAAYAGREQHCPDKYVIGVRTDVPASFADYLVLPAANVVPLPEEMPILHGALIEPLAVAVHAVRRAGLRADGDADPAVLVLGGGPIGQSVVLALRMAGVEKVVVSEPTASRRSLVEQVGCRTVDPTGGSGRLDEQVHEILGGPPRYCLDAVGLAASMNDALRLSAPDATVVLVGMGAPRLDLDAYAISTGERTVRGSFAYSRADFDDAAAWMAAAGNDPARLISEVVDPETAHDAFTRLAHADAAPGKVLVAFDDAVLGG